MSFIVGLTGNIGSGKSTISKIFSTLKIPIFYADEEAKKLLDSEHIIPKLQNIFGDKIVDKNQKIDKQNLAAIVFNDEKLLQKLNNIIHPEVYNQFLKWHNQNKAADYVIMEAAILFESGFDKYVDISINVHTDKNIRLKRVMKRDSVEKGSVLARMQNQLTDEEKIKLADHTIDNNGDKLILPQLLKIHARLKNKKGSK